MAPLAANGFMAFMEFSFMYDYSHYMVYYRAHINNDLEIYILSITLFGGERRQLSLTFLFSAFSEHIFSTLVSK